jgi:hypothetical protein
MDGCSDCVLQQGSQFILLQVCSNNGLGSPLLQQFAPAMTESYGAVELTGLKAANDCSQPVQDGASCSVMWET